MAILLIFKPNTKKGSVFARSNKEITAKTNLAPVHLTVQFSGKNVIKL